MDNLNYIDYTIIAVIGISTLVAYFRGLITEVMSFLVWVAAFWGAITYYNDVAKILPSLLGNRSGVAIDANLQNISDASGEGMIVIALSFIITFLAILFIAGLFNLLVSLLIRHLKISWLDRILGVIFGFFRGVLAVLIAGTFVIHSDLSEMMMWKEARLSPTVTEWVHTFSKFIPADFLAQINTKNLAERIKISEDAELKDKQSFLKTLPNIPSPKPNATLENESQENTQTPSDITSDNEQTIEYIEHTD